MFTMKGFRAAAFLLAALLFPGAASAALGPGDAVRVRYFYPDLGTLYQGNDATLTGSANTLPGFAGILNISVEPTLITLSLITTAGVNPVSFDGVRFTDVNGTLSFSSFVLDTTATTYAGFSASRITLDGSNDLLLNLQGLPGQPGQAIVLGAVPIPEPGTWMLLAAGIAVLVAITRRRVPAPLVMRG
jgi:hypothetical protein